MGKKLLIIFEDNWADEMDIQGFDILTKEHWEYKKLELQHTQFPNEIGIGTNQFIDYDTVEEYLKQFKVTPISNNEEEFLQKYFDKYSFGIFPLIEGEAPDEFYEEHGYCPE